MWIEFVTENGRVVFADVQKVFVGGAGSLALFGANDVYIDEVPAAMARPVVRRLRAAAALGAGEALLEVTEALEKVYGKKETASS